MAVMATTKVSVTIRVADLERTRTFLWELMVLMDRMRVMANPEAEALERIVDRYNIGADDDRPFADPDETDPGLNDPPEPGE